ncbi:MAG: prepilin-type N-terminal cleavage/methylation domain-containing protein [Clostridia bacterium]|nr:prepilin-type N-terminal cleavage/methylation domain-containing protein [Clostridia bacterium]
MKKSKGITLIALVITIIVMLILVGVTINVALNGGLFGKAGEAKDRTNLAKEKEMMQAAALGYLDDDGYVDLETFATEQNNKIEGYTLEDKGTYVTASKEDGTTFYVTKQGGITEEEPSGNSAGSIYDVAYVNSSYYKVIVLKNNGLVYTIKYRESSVDDISTDSYSLGSKNDYEEEIEEFFEDEDMPTELRDEVILVEGEINILFYTKNGQEILNNGKGEYIRDDSFDISNIEFPNSPDYKN